MNTIIDTNRDINFGIYRCSKITPYGKRDTGIYKDKIIDIVLTKLLYLSFFINFFNKDSIFIIGIFNI